MKGTMTMGRKMTSEQSFRFSERQIKQASEYIPASIEQVLVDFQRWTTALTVTHAGGPPKTLLELLLQDSLDSAIDSSISAISNVKWLTRAREVVTLRSEIATQTSGKSEQDLEDALKRAIEIFNPAWLTKDMLRSCWRRHFMPEKAGPEHKKRFMAYFEKYLHQGGFLFEYQNQLNEQFVIHQLEYSPFGEDETTVFFRNKPGEKDRLRISVQVNEQDIEIESALGFEGLCLHTDRFIHKLTPTSGTTPELTAKFHLTIENDEVVPHVKLESKENEMINLMRQCEYKVESRFLVIRQNNQFKVIRGDEMTFNELLAIQGENGIVSVKALPVGLPEQEQTYWLHKWKQGITDDYRATSDWQKAAQENVIPSPSKEVEKEAKSKFQEMLSMLFSRARAVFARIMNIIWPRAQVTERQGDKPEYQPISQVDEPDGHKPHP
jgi:hypothetical protein